MQNKEVVIFIIPRILNEKTNLVEKNGKVLLEKNQGRWKVLLKKKALC